MENMIYFVKCHDGRIIFAKIIDISQKGKIILSITGKLYTGDIQDVKISEYPFYRKYTKYINLSDLMPFRKHEIQNKKVSFCEEINVWFFDCF